MLPCLLSKAYFKKYFYEMRVRNCNFCYLRKNVFLYLIFLRLERNRLTYWKKIPQYFVQSLRKNSFSTPENIRKLLTIGLKWVKVSEIVLTVAYFELLKEPWRYIEPFSCSKPWCVENWFEKLIATQ